MYVGITSAYMIGMNSIGVGRNIVDLCRKNINIGICRNSINIGASSNSISVHVGITFALVVVRISIIIGGRYRNSINIGVM